MSTESLSGLHPAERRVVAQARYRDEAEEAAAAARRALDSAVAVALYEGFSYRQIARLMGVSVGAVQTAAKRYRERTGPEPLKG